MTRQNGASFNLNDYDVSNLQEYLMKIVDYVSEYNEYVKKGADSIMGGTVLETYADKCLAKGFAEGERLMKKAMILIFKEGCSTVEELVERGIPAETALKALEK